MRDRVYSRHGHNRAHPKTAPRRHPALQTPERPHPGRPRGENARAPSNGLQAGKRRTNHAVGYPYGCPGRARPRTGDPPADHGLDRRHRGSVLMARRPIHAPLNVYMNARLVGQLRRESSGAIDFQYDKDWLAWVSAIPVSVSLPLREDRYIGDPVLAVFENLLPDNDDIRRRVAERSQADGSDTYSLLSAIGRDCVGALQFLPEGMAPASACAIDGRAVDDKEIAAMVSNLARNPLGIGPDQE